MKCVRVEIIHNQFIPHFTWLQNAETLSEWQTNWQSAVISEWLHTLMACSPLPVPCGDDFNPLMAHLPVLLPPSVEDASNKLVNASDEMCTALSETPCTDHLQACDISRGGG